MTDEKIARITALAEDCYQKQVRYENMSMQNIAHLDYEERKKSAVAYALAEAELNEAKALLASAKTV